MADKNRTKYLKNIQRIIFNLISIVTKIISRQNYFVYLLLKRKKIIILLKIC